MSRGGVVMIASLATMLAWRVAAAQPATAGALDLTGPSQLVLGRDARAVISLRVAAVVPVLVASTGTIGPAVAVDGGRLEAVYEPPAQRVPAVAIIAALDPRDGELIDWLAIPLHAQAQVTARVDRAARVVIAVAGVDHGPFSMRAGERTEVPVVVPPGVDRATMVAIDGAGRETRRILALGVPPLARVLALCPAGRERLTVVVAGADGRPGAAGDLELRAAVGRLEAPVAVAGIAGVFRADWIAPPQMDALIVRLEAATPGVAGSSCEAHLDGESPIAITLTPSSVERLAPGVTIDVEVELGYAGRRPPAEVTVAVTSDRGEVGALRRLDGSRWVATWAVPPAGAGGSATLRARAGQSTARLELHLPPGTPVAPRVRAAYATAAVHAGYQTNLARVSGPLVRVELTARSGRLGHRLGVGVTAGFYASDAGAMTAAAEDVHIEVLAIPLLARVTVDVVPAAHLYLGATAGIIVGRTTMSSISAGVVDESLLRPAIGALGGGRLELGPGVLTIELGWLQATAVGATHGAVGGASITGGYGLAL